MVPDSEPKAGLLHGAQILLERLSHPGIRRSGKLAGSYGVGCRVRLCYFFLQRTRAGALLWFLSFTGGMP